MSISTVGTSLIAACSIQVTGGRHKGALAPLEGDECTVGSHADCDIVLSDKGVAPNHLLVRFDGRSLRLEAGNEPAIVNGRLLPGGHGLVTRLPAEVQLGEASLRIACHQALQELVVWPLGAKWMAGVATAVIAIAMIVQAGTGSANLTPIPDSADQEKAAAAETLPSRIHSEFSRQLAQAGLTTISLSLEGRHLIASGRIPGEKQADWRAAQEWFDRTNGARFTLSNMVTTAQAQANPAILLQAVWLGEDPHIVTEGRRIRPGDSIGDGWKLSAIESGRIEFKRSDESFSLTF